MSSSSSASSSSINVLIRLRPCQHSSIDSIEVGKSLEIDETNGKVVVNRKHKGNTVFTFDDVLGTQRQQRHLFEKCNYTNDILNGINACIMAYGQTSSGKTHSLFGSHWLEDPASAALNGNNFYQKDKEIMPQPSSASGSSSNNNNNDNNLNNTSDLTGDQLSIDEMNDREDFGLVPRNITVLFDTLESMIKSNSNKKFDYSVHCHVMQIYNERIYDLIQDRKRKRPLPLRDTGVTKENINGGVLHKVHVKGLSSYRIHTKEEAEALVRRALRNRALRNTEMNIDSSRSHTILQLFIQVEEEDDNGVMVIKRSTFTFVDLAGSEKLGAKTSDNWQMSAQLENQNSIKETANINTSLHVLGMCVSSLIEPQKTNHHIPYRSSVLTRLLQDQLGGQGKTTLIATIHEDNRYVDETYSTLQFAARASRVKMSIIPLSDYSAVSGAGGADIKLANARKQIEQLKQKLLQYESCASTPSRGNNNNNNSLTASRRKTTAAGIDSGMSTSIKMSTSASSPASSSSSSSLSCEMCGELRVMMSSLQKRVNTLETDNKKKTEEAKYLESENIRLQKYVDLLSETPTIHQTNLTNNANSVITKQMSFSNIPNEAYAKTSQLLLAQQLQKSQRQLEQVEESEKGGDRDSSSSKQDSDNDEIPSHTPQSSPSSSAAVPQEQKDTLTDSQSDTAAEETVVVQSIVQNLVNKIAQTASRKENQLRLPPPVAATATPTAGQAAAIARAMALSNTTTTSTNSSTITSTNSSTITNTMNNNSNNNNSNSNSSAMTSVKGNATTTPASTSASSSSVSSYDDKSATGAEAQIAAVSVVTERNKPFSSLSLHSPSPTVTAAAGIDSQRQQSSVSRGSDSSRRQSLNQQHSPASSNSTPTRAAAAEKTFNEIQLASNSISVSATTAINASSASSNRTLPPPSSPPPPAMTTAAALTTTNATNTNTNTSEPPPPQQQQQQQQKQQQIGSDLRASREALRATYQSSSGVFDSDDEEDKFDWNNFNNKNRKTSQVGLKTPGSSYKDSNASNGTGGSGNGSGNVSGSSGSNQTSPSNAAALMPRQSNLTFPSINGNTNTSMNAGYPMNSSSSSSSSSAIQMNSSGSASETKLPYLSSGTSSSPFGMSAPYMVNSSSAGSQSQSQSQSVLPQRIVVGSANGAIAYQNELQNATRIQQNNSLSMTNNNKNNNNGKITTTASLQQQSAAAAASSSMPSSILNMYSPYTNSLPKIFCEEDFNDNSTPAAASDGGGGGGGGDNKVSNVPQSLGNNNNNKLKNKNAVSVGGKKR